MKKLLVILFLAGCSSPAEDYVRADQHTWEVFDKDAWLDQAIDADTKMSVDRKDALHQLNVARRARIEHAVAAIGSQ